MKLKAKQIFFVGAFIVLTVIGYMILPRDEIVIDLNSSILETGATFNEKSQANVENQDFISGNLKSKDIIYVHIEGAVNNPGIKEVPKDTRLFELIEIAGNELDEADLSKVNLASVLKDEQKVYIPYKVLVDESANVSLNETTSINKAYNNNTNVNDSSLILVNINTATSEELQKLDGIGPSMAKKILDYRENTGYFNSIEEIKNVSGIGEAKYNKIKDSICT